MDQTKKAAVVWKETRDATGLHGVGRLHEILPDGTLSREVLGEVNYLPGSDTSSEEADKWLWQRADRLGYEIDEQYGY